MANLIGLLRSPGQRMRFCRTAGSSHKNRTGLVERTGPGPGLTSMPGPSSRHRSMIRHVTAKCLNLTGPASGGQEKQGLFLKGNGVPRFFDCHTQKEDLGVVNGRDSDEVLPER